MDAMHSETVAYWIAKYFNKGLRYRENIVCIDTRTFDLFMFETSRKSITVYTQLLISYKDSFLDQDNFMAMMWSRF